MVNYTLLFPSLNSKIKFQEYPHYLLKKLYLLLPYNSVVHPTIFIQSSYLPPEDGLVARNIYLDKTWIFFFYNDIDTRRSCTKKVQPL